MSDETQHLEPDQSHNRLDQLFAIAQLIRAELANAGQRLGNLEQKVEARLRDTAPLGETLELIRADIRQLQTGQGQIQVEQQQMRAEISEGFDILTEKINILSQDLLQTRADQERLKKRLT